MNLFYLLGTNNYLIDSNLDITSSPVNSDKDDGVSLYPYILAFKDQSMDGVQVESLDTLSYTFGTNQTYFKYYSDFVIVDNVCNFIGCTTYSDATQVISYVNIDNTSYAENSVLNTVEWTGITYGNGVYCIVGVSGTNEITIGTSGDKVTWSYNTITTLWATNNPRVSFGNGVFILTDASIYRSTSGTSWDMVYDDPIWGWDNVEFCNQGFIAYNKLAFYCGISSDGILWNTDTLPSIIGSDATLASWKNIISNGDILCMKSSPDIEDSSSGMSSVTFSNDGGLSWMTQTLLDGANQGIISLSVPNFWEHFNKTSES